MISVEDIIVDAMTEYITELKEIRDARAKLHVRETKAWFKVVDKISVTPKGLIVEQHDE